MNLQDLGSIGEFVGAFLVLATLFYLTIQVRANTRSNQLMMFESFTKDMNDINMGIAQDVELTRIWKEGTTHPEQLSATDADRYFFLIAQYFNLFNAIWGLRSSDNIDEHFTRWTEEVLVNIVQDPGPWMYFQAQKGTMDPDFVVFVEEQRQKKVSSIYSTDWRQGTNRQDKAGG